MRRCYIPKRFTRSSMKTILRANEILEEYRAQGFVLTLRQLYYQFVSRDFLRNNQKEYKRLGSTIGDGRLAGLIDWDMLEDRTRNLQTLTHFDGPTDALKRLSGWYRTDLWAGQKFRPEVWIEKDALAGVIEGVCQENDVPYFSCRGYTSLSEMYHASLRLRKYVHNRQTPYILHFGDHDPSGIDMSRDIQERLCHTFMADFTFNRIALNVEQIEEFNPPPNPAKVTDSRYQTYLETYGDESWELDALEPSKFRSLIEERLASIRNQTEWNKAVAEDKAVRAKLTQLADSWNRPPKVSENELKKGIKKALEVLGKPKTIKDIQRASDTLRSILERLNKRA